MNTENENQNPDLDGDDQDNGGGGDNFILPNTRAPRKGKTIAITPNGHADSAVWLADGSRLSFGEVAHVSVAEGQDWLETGLVKLAPKEIPAE